MNAPKKTTITNNINVKSNPLTTIFGGIMSLIGIGMILQPLFYVAKAPLPLWTGWVMLGLGILLLFAPDKLITGLGKVVDRKSDQI